VEGLRVSGASTARQRAADFVAAHGDGLAQLRGAALLGEVPVRDVVAALDADSTEAIRRMLRICDDLRALGQPEVARAAAWLERLQEEDGSWSGPAVEPLDARLQRTGALAGHLAKTRFARPETLEAAGDFLAAHFSPERLQGFQWENIDAYAHFFANCAHEAADAVLQWCGRELERGFRTRTFDAPHTARVLLDSDAHSLPGGRADASEVAIALVDEQSADGGWGLPDTPPFERVESTLTALTALVRWGREESHGR
jgi:hypothetical protein